MLMKDLWINCIRMPGWVYIDSSSSSSELHSSCGRHPGIDLPWIVRSWGGFFLNLVQRKTCYKKILRNCDESIENLLGSIINWAVEIRNLATCWASKRKDFFFNLLFKRRTYIQIHQLYSLILRSCENLEVQVWNMFFGFQMILSSLSIDFESMNI